MNNEFILSEGVLNDNILITPPSGKVFKGGYIAAIKEYTYQNAWSNREHIKMFRSEQALEKYIKKNYPEFELELL